MKKNNDFLKYKDYLGSIEYDLEENILWGKILFIDDLITYEGSTIEELQNSFRYMVDDYLETCKQVGKTPQKAYSGTFNIRTIPETHQILAEIAKLENISLNKLINYIFNDYINSANMDRLKLVIKNLSNA